jgi:hypothetical protein
MFVVPFIAGSFVFAGLLTFTRVESRHRRVWRTSAARGRTRAPKLIRQTALWSIYMGQMAVPGAVLGLIGTVFGGLGLASIPGLILAVRIWRLGLWLLEQDPRAAGEARRLHGFAVVLNAIAMAIGLMLLLVGAWPVTAVLWIYAGISLAHAEAMRRCARLLECEQPCTSVRTDYERAHAAA